jgi:hypothetical protein
MRRRQSHRPDVGVAPSLARLQCEALPQQGKSQEAVLTQERTTVTAKATMTWWSSAEFWGVMGALGCST